jgi:hypothetical protein
LVYRRNFNYHFALKANVLFGKVFADDAESGRADQELRNLHFRSKLTEFSGQVEFNFNKYRPGEVEHPITPYVFVGLSLFRMNPQAELNGEWYELRQLGTEGQGTSIFGAPPPYSLMQVSLPFGAGLKLNLSDLVNVSLEWGLRKTYTDYLDDASTVYVDPTVLAVENGPVAPLLADRSVSADPVSNIGLQRGNSKSKDWYSFAGILITFNFKSKPTCQSAFGKNK